MTRKKDDAATASAIPEALKSLMEEVATHLANRILANEDNQEQVNRIAITEEISALKALCLYAGVAGKLIPPLTNGSGFNGWQDALRGSGGNDGSAVSTESEPDF